MESDKDIGYHIRRDAFTKKTKSYPVTLESGNKVPGIISYDSKEGIVRSNRGDILINKWGFRGPYVEKEKPNHIYRIVTLGGSTTAGKHENESTYPRLLERLLNSQSDGRKYYQVLNFGVWGYNSWWFIVGLLISAGVGFSALEHIIDLNLVKTGEA